MSNDNNLWCPFCLDEHAPCDAFADHGIKAVDYPKLVRELQLDNARLREALELAQNGLFWYRENTDLESGCDYEVMEIIEEALSTTSQSLVEHEADNIPGIAARLRRVVRALNLTDAVPDDDLSLYRCMFSVLGIIANKLQSSHEIG